MMIVFAGHAAAAERKPALPRTAPAPQANPQAQSETTPAQDVPLPSPAPETSPSQPQPLPANAEAPLPEKRPPTEKADTSAVPEAAKPAGTASKETGPRQSVGRHNATNFTRPIDEKLVGADAACRARLTAMGAVFETAPPLSDPQGCAVPFPISVSKLGPDIALEPAAMLNCPMAEAAAKFAATTISPQAEAVYKSKLKAIANASAYVCRPRNGTKKLSEHAFGNALDMARFVLADGTAIDVAATRDPKAEKFLAEVRKAACGPFKTVLGPGSDADHAYHFHFDLAFRRSGATFCQ